MYLPGMVKLFSGKLTQHISSNRKFVYFILLIIIEYNKYNII